MPNILYIHGFGSSFDPTSNKVEALKSIGNIIGIDIDWTERPSTILETVGTFILKNNIDLIVGTSMGGWAASHLGSNYGIPFVSINPAVNPAMSLSRHIGEGIDWEGRPFVLTEEAVSEYTPLKTGGCGLILLDLADDVIDARNTINIYSEHYHCVEFKGGSHRFEHIKESLAMIKDFYEESGYTYGLEGF